MCAVVLKQYVQATLPRRYLIGFDRQQLHAGLLVLVGLIGFETGTCFIFTREIRAAYSTRSREPA